MLEFSRLRSAVDGWRGSFEGLIRQLGRSDPPAEAREFRHIHGAGGDGGIEAYWLLRNDDKIGYQAKFHTHVRLIDWGAIDGSVRTAMKTHPTLVRIVVAVACDLTDRVSGRSGRTGWEAWEAYRARWADLVSADGRKVEFELWGASEIEQRLSAPVAAGLREYWFEEMVLSRQWFETQFDRTVAMLDERFHPEDHVEVQAAAVFDGLRRTPSWRTGLEAAIELIRQHSGLAPASSSQEVHNAFFKVGEAVQAVLVRKEILHRPHDQSLPIAEWQADLQVLSDALRFATNVLEKDRRLAAADNDRRELYRRDHELLKKLWEPVSDLQGKLRSDEQQADARRSVIVVGRAGSGKSHFLASQTAAMLAAGEPAIMVLGTDFVGIEDPGAQIIRRLGLQMPFLTFLGMMNAAAESQGSRALLIIDALNEGAGSALWKERLSGFVTSVLKFDRLALCVSCRTEFVDYVLSASARSNPVEVVLHGFTSDEEQERAAEIYMDRRGILRPSTPWPSPEFSNPLFLRTACVALESEGRNTFPPGLRGTRELISFYLDTAARHLGTGYDGSDELVTPLRHAMVKLAAAMAAKRADFVDRHSATGIIDEAFSTFERPAGVTWLDVLRRHGLVRSDPGPLDDDPLAVCADVYRFGFQRFQDHLTAQALLEGAYSYEGMFTEGGPLSFMLGRFGVEQSWSGVFQALTIEFADRWKKELVDCLPGGFDRWWFDPVVEDAFIESVRWRALESFGPRTDALLDEMQGGLEAFDLFVELSPVPRHPLNGSRIHGLLSPLALALRDARWTTYVNQAYTQSGHPAARLIEWCFGVGMPRASNESLRLVLLVLGWCFASTDGRVRDRSTKAAVAILLERPALVSDYVAAFASVDDLYVIERVMASVAGACLVDPAHGRLEFAAAAIWKNIFAQGMPAPHLLMRDYARLVIELANDRGALSADCDLRRCRPPYGSQAPEFGLIKAEVEAEAKSVGDYAIMSSCAGWGGDFGRYIIENRLRDFTSIPLSAPRPRKHEQAFGEFRERYVHGDDLRELYLDLLVFWHGQRDGADEGALVELSEWIADVERFFLSEISSEVAEIYERDAKPYLLGETGWQDTAEDELPGIDFEQGKLWVAQRALRLGWTREIFPRDSSGGPDRARSSRTERIGKKYQWIAFHELTARLADNFWLNPDWEEANARVYDTPRDLEFNRDIDPTIPPADRLPVAGLLQVPGIGIDEIKPEGMQQWVFDERIAKERMKLGLCDDVDGDEEWLTLYRYGKAKVRYLPKEAHYRAPLRQDDFHFVQMVGLPITERARFKRDTHRLRVDFHKWLGEDLTDGPFLYEAGIRSTWPEREWVNTSVWPEGAFEYLSFTSGYHWEWHIDGTLPDGFTLRAPNPWLIRALGLSADRQMPGHYRDASGRLSIASYDSGRDSYCLVRRSIILDLLKELDVAPIWLGFGERTAWPDRNENSGPRRRWNGVAWLQVNGLRSEIWNEDHIP